MKINITEKFSNNNFTSTNEIVTLAVSEVFVFTLANFRLLIFDIYISLYIYIYIYNIREIFKIR